MSVEEQLKYNQDVMIQLPWTVPQQPLYTASIQVDPETQKIPLDLNVSSTDTTAISSFTISMIIALILGGFATWLAYWYGRKSFKLTEMSFKSLVLEIQSSQQTAFDLNQKLFEQQIALQKNELQSKERIVWNDLVYEICADCNILINNYIFKAQEIIKFYLRTNSRDKSNPSSIFGEKIGELEEISHQLILKNSKLDLYLEDNNDMHEYFIKLLDHFTILSQEFIDEFYNKHSIELFEVFEDLSHIEYGDNKILRLASWKNGNKLNRLEILSLLMREINKNLKNNLRIKAA